MMVAERGACSGRFEPGRARVVPGRPAPGRDRRTGPAGLGRLGAALAAILAIAGGVLATPPTAASAQEGGPDGAALYEQWCAGCHGAEGQGDGPAARWMLPRPRDFTKALYQIRSTPSGQLPTDQDILRVINQGMPGTTMPGWDGVLTRAERQALVDHLKSLSPFFANSPAAEPMEFSDAPGASDERIAEGAEVYERVECYRCHGQEGRGDGSSAPTLEDDADRPIRAADLTEGWMFNGGHSVEEIFRRMRTGLDGTPMPSQSDLISGGVITEEELWSLAHYVRSLSPEESPPPIREVIEAELVEEGPLPEGVDDERWGEVDRFYIPLVGQIIQEQRWFDPRVDGVWIQALHDGSDLALRLSWSDPSRSPDSAWIAEWQPRVLAAMEPTASQGVEPGSRPDRIALQFPTEVTEGNERPYFLMGDGRTPVYLWSWESAGGGATELEARGITSQSTHAAGTQNLTSDAAFEAGQWRVLLRRPLEAADDAAEIGFAMGEMVPVAFFAWDGDNGEEGTRGAISAWYFLHLAEPASNAVYVAPLAAMALTALLGVGVVARAQRRERQGGAGGGEAPSSGPSAPEARHDEESEHES